MPKLENWGREENLERKQIPYVWRHGQDETLRLQIEAADYNPSRKSQPPFYKIVLRRKYRDRPLARIGTRKNKSDAYNLAVKWMDNHPDPKQARENPF